MVNAVYDNNLYYNSYYTIPDNNNNNINSFMDAMVMEYPVYWTAIASRLDIDSNY
jgi:hypothetical protein